MYIYYLSVAVNNAWAGPISCEQNVAAWEAAGDGKAFTSRGRILNTF